MQLVIFDIDGTLTDTNSSDNACFLQAFKESLGICDLNEDWTSYSYSTDSGIVREILEKHRGSVSGKDVELLKTRFVELLVGHFTSQPIRPIRGAAEILRHLTKEPDWFFAIATGGWKESALLKLRTAQIGIGEAPFASSDEICAREDILRAVINKAEKFHPEPFERIVYVGDATWDVATAIEMGLPFVGIASGLRRQQLLKAGASHVLENYLDYRSTLDALNHARIPEL